MSANQSSSSAEDGDLPLSLADPYGPRQSSCGYCGGPGKRSASRSSFTFGLQTVQLSAAVYQAMIDRGWRRSGTYCYKPDLARSCCPQYTIRLDAFQFSPSRSQRKVVYRFERFLRGDRAQGPSSADAGSQELGAIKSAKAAKQSKGGDFDLVKDIRDLTAQRTSDAHRYEVTLEPSSFTTEKWKLFCAYQRSVHHDDDKSQYSFKNFLCDSPIARQRVPFSKPANDVPEHLPREYGSYHQMYRLDGKLIAIGVIDILPKCVSGVYLIYDPQHDEHSLGKLSALHEIALVRELSNAGAPGMEYMYMGFYIHSCQKMRYKAQYAPSFLLEPEDKTWHPMEVCLKLLDKFAYVPFSHPERASRPLDPSATALSAGDDDKPEDFEFDDDESDELRSDEPNGGVGDFVKDVQIGIMARRKLHILRFEDTPYWEDPDSRQLLARTCQLLGEWASRRIVMKL